MIVRTLSTAGIGAGAHEVRASPSGKYLVTSGSVVCVLDGKTGALVARRAGQASSAHLASDADVWLIADGKLVRWTFASGVEAKIATTAESISGWGTLVVAYGGSSKPHLWNLATNKKHAIAPPSPLRKGTVASELERTPVVSRDGMRAALLFGETVDGKAATHMRVIDATTGKPILDVAHYTDYSASPGRSYAMIRKQGTTRGTWIETEDFDLYHGPQLAFDARGRLVTHLYDKTHVYDASSGALLDRLENATGVMVMSEDRLLLLDDSAHEARTIKLAPKLAIERTLSLPKDFLVVTAALGTDVLASTFNALTLMTYPKLATIPLTAGHDDAFSATFSPDGKLLATIDERKLIVWDTKSGKRLRELQAEYHAAFSPDGKSLAVSEPDGVKIWSVESWRAKPVARTKWRRGAAWIGWTTKGAFRMIETQQDGRVRIYDGVTARVLHDLGQALGDGRIISCGLSPDDAYFAAAFADDEGWAIWDLAAKQRVYHGEVEGRIVFQPSGAYVACGSRVGGLEVVKLADRRVARKDWASTDLVFAGDLVVAASDGDVVIATASKLVVTQKHRGRGFECVASTADGKRLAVGASGGQLELWDLT